MASDAPLDLATEVRNLRTAFVDWKFWTRLGLIVLAVDLVWTLAVSYTTVRDYEFRTCMQSWAAQFTNRSLALGSNKRVDLFLQAYADAAGAATPLTATERARVIAGLDEARKQFPVVPMHAALVKAHDYQLLSYRDLIASLRANIDYHKISRAHPVPSAPTCGGLL